MLEVTTVVIHATEFESVATALGTNHPFVARAREALQDDSPDVVKYREAASRHHSEGELEVDAGAAVSIGVDCGAYVSVWLWIDAAEAGVTVEAEEVDG